MSRSKTPKPQRIAVLRYRFIGDTLLSLPFVRALRSEFPDAVIDYYAGQDAISLVELWPEVSGAFAFEPRHQGFWGCVKQLRAGRYDRVYVLKRSLSSALMAFLAGIPERIGFDTEHRGLLLTQRIPYTPQDEHESQQFLKALSYNPVVESTHLNDIAQMTLPEDISAAAQSRLADYPGRKILIHPASTNRDKCWPLTSYQALISKLHQTLLEQQRPPWFVFLGAPADRGLHEQLLSALPPAVQARSLNWVGETSLIESMALMSQMDLLVAGDCGLIHMAGAVGTPQVALFGPTDPKQWQPLSDKATVLSLDPPLACQPCRLVISCDHRLPCLTELSVEKVFAACLSRLNS